MFLLSNKIYWQAMLNNLKVGDLGGQVIVTLPTGAYCLLFLTDNYLVSASTFLMTERRVSVLSQLILLLDI